MSASFECAGQMFWGTNGLIDACLDCFEKIAVADYGDSDPIAAWCRREREKFFPGAVVDMDPLLHPEDIRTRLASVVAKSEGPLKRDYQLTELGLSWVDRELPKLVAVITPKNA